MLLPVPLRPSRQQKHPSDNSASIDETTGAESLYPMLRLLSRSLVIEKQKMGLVFMVIGWSRPSDHGVLSLSHGVGILQTFRLRLYRISILPKDILNFMLLVGDIII